jgi:hypothetical protein
MAMKHGDAGMRMVATKKGQHAGRRNRARISAPVGAAVTAMATASDAGVAEWKAENLAGFACAAPEGQPVLQLNKWADVGQLPVCVFQQLRHHVLVNLFPPEQLGITYRYEVTVKREVMR